MATLYDADGNEVEVPDEALQPEGQQGPAGLRKHAKQLEADLKAEREARAAEIARLAEYEKRDAFDAAAKEAGVDGLSLEDVKDLPKEQITATTLRVKAAEKEQAQQARLAELAQTLGTTPEALAETIKAQEAKKAQEAADRAAATGIAAGGQAPPPGETKETPSEKGLEAWKQAREHGTPQDLAEAEFVRAATEATFSKAGTSA